MESGRWGGGGRTAPPVYPSLWELKGEGGLKPAPAAPVIRGFGVPSPPAQASPGPPPSTPHHPELGLGHPRPRRATVYHRLGHWTPALATPPPPHTHRHTPRAPPQPPPRIVKWRRAVYPGLGNGGRGWGVGAEERDSLFFFFFLPRTGPAGFSNLLYPLPPTPCPSPPPLPAVWKLCLWPWPKGGEVEGAEALNSAQTAFCI